MGGKWGEINQRNKEQKQAFHPWRSSSGSSAYGNRGRTLLPQMCPIKSRIIAAGTSTGGSLGSSHSVLSQRAQPWERMEP